MDNSNVLQGVGETFIVLSGKGGVGKSTTASQLAFTLHAMGFKVGILDVDLCGPSMARLLGVENEDVHSTPDGKWVPVKVDDRLSVLSMAFFLSSKEQAVVWRGPKKNSMIKQMLTNVVWNVDYLVIDTPPGTSDEHLSVMENLSGIGKKSCILVTTPQMMSVDDVVKELSFCRRAELPIQGVIENMSGYVCPNCSECSNILAEGGGRIISEKYSIPFLGRIPIEPNLSMCGETGQSYIKKFEGSEVAKTFREIASKLIKFGGENSSADAMDVDQ